MVWTGVPRFLARQLLVPSSWFSSSYTCLVAILRSDTWISYLLSLLSFLPFLGFWNSWWYYKYRFFGWTNLCREEIGSLNEFIMLYTSCWLIKRALVHARSMWKLYSSFRFACQNWVHYSYQFQCPWFLWEYAFFLEGSNYRYSFLNLLKLHWENDDRFSLGWYGHT